LRQLSISIMWIMTAQLNADLLLQSAKQIFRGADADGDRAVDADEFHAYLAQEMAREAALRGAEAAEAAAALAEGRVVPRGGRPAPAARSMLEFVRDGHPWEKFYPGDSLASHNHQPPRPGDPIVAFAGVAESRAASRIQARFRGRRDRLRQLEALFDSYDYDGNGIYANL
jgi:hypothetical protein